MQNSNIFKSLCDFKINQKNQGNGLHLLNAIKDEVIKVAFFDPQYRGVMDKMKYGNEGARQKKRIALEQMNEEIITSFIKEINRCLMSSGYLFLWIDKFHLCEGINDWLLGTSLKKVDLITWDKMRMGMGYRTRRQSEYLMVLQKLPLKAKDTWSVKNIRDVHSEKISNENAKKHPHTKPLLLQEKLIEATSFEGDFILDPASGSYSVMEVALKINRNFIGCDLIATENN